MPRYLQMPCDGDLELAGIVVLVDRFGTDTDFTIESIEATDHGGREWSAVAQVYDNKARAYVGVLRWRGVGEDVDDMDDVIFEPQSCAE